MVRRKFAPVPRVTSKTITVGSLLGKIKRLILSEPKRLDMGDWVSIFKGTSRDDAEKPMPACGTVACLAGWGAVLLRSDQTTHDQLNLNADSAIEQAIGVDIGSDSRDVGLLFASFAAYEFNEDTNYDLPPAGTMEHANVIAKRIETYLAKHPEIVNRKIVVADVQKALRG